MLKVYFVPSCSTCQTALALLEGHTKEKLELEKYHVDAPSEEEITDLLRMLNLKAEDIIRKKEPLYKEKYEGKKRSQKQWIKILSKNPVLIERPIVVKDGKAIIGRPPERVLELLV